MIKINIPSWVADPIQILEQNGHQAFVVGGAVRDSLLGNPVKDWDIATSATPQEVTRIFENLSVFVYPTGIDHGTVTLVPVHWDSVEVTTFRKDFLCDGRHAEVEFTSFEEDAKRRDLTINALYATADGTVLDPTGDGYMDLRNGTIRFVGNPDERIQEDRLRFLRAIRFAMKYGFMIELESMRAMWNTGNDVLQNISMERILSEISRFNLKSHNVHLIFEFQQVFCRVFGARIINHHHLTSEDYQKFSELPWFYFWLFHGVSPNWFLNDPRISKVIKKKIQIYQNVTVQDDPVLAAMRFGRENILELQKFHRIQFSDCLPYRLDEEIPEELVRMPLSSKNLMEAGFTGKDLGRFIDIATEIWCDFRFQISEEYLYNLTRIKYDFKCRSNNS